MGNRQRVLSYVTLAALAVPSLAGSGGVAATTLHAAAAVESFAHPAFQRTWERTDRPVSFGQVQRSWYWGPNPNSGGLLEDYAEGVGGKRLVQYFDKSRMEINNPGGDQNNPFFVTNGLLTVELISGKMQVGNHVYVDRPAANIPLASDTDDPNAPTYVSFQGVANTTLGDHPAPNRVGQFATATINKAGQVGNDPSRANLPGARLAHFEGTTRHNIPQVVWDFLNLSGPVYNPANGQNVNGRLSDPWFYTTGLPISEPYWAKVKIANQPNVDVMIQAFERRVVTYVPTAPAGFQVQMSNIGQHYYDWRYAGTPPAPTVPPAATATTAPPAAATATATTAPAAPTATATATTPAAPTATPTPVPPQVWTHPINILSNRTYYYLRLTGPGEIRARATWSGSQANLALIINGPGQTGFYARQDGPSTLEVSYTVTPADFATGDTWRVAVASFGTGEAEGSIQITYPSGSPTSPLQTNFVVSPNSGSAVNVVVLRGPGPVAAQMNWTGTPANLALIINGPGQTGFYARQDGPSVLSVNYVVTPADFAAGANWLIRAVSFSAGTDVTGNIQMAYP
ncbi:MAG: hypothetical protein M3441_10580 [Chloroflexota bacterium]|nr:hypothetical protein [Chloroflexota bacterium]